MDFSMLAATTTGSVIVIVCNGESDPIYSVAGATSRNRHGAEMQRNLPAICLCRHIFIHEFCCRPNALAMNRFGSKIQHCRMFARADQMASDQRCCLTVLLGECFGHAGYGVTRAAHLIIAAGQVFLPSPRSGHKGPSIRPVELIRRRVQFRSSNRRHRRFCRLGEVHPLSTNCVPPISSFCNEVEQW